MRHKPTPLQAASRRSRACRAGAGVDRAGRDLRAFAIAIVDDAYSQECHVPKQCSASGRLRLGDRHADDEQLNVGRAEFDDHWNPRWPKQLHAHLLARRSGPRGVRHQSSLSGHVDFDRSDRQSRNLIAASQLSGPSGGQIGAEAIERRARKLGDFLAVHGCPNRQLSAILHRSAGSSSRDCSGGRAVRHGLRHRDERQPISAVLR